MSPQLHGRLRDEAVRRQISLNELCLRAIENYLDSVEPNEDEPSIRNERLNGEGLAGQTADPWIRTVRIMFGSSLIGVVLFGSTARGEARTSSDVDLLVCLDRDVPLNRGLYERWERSVPDDWKVPPGEISPHFVHLPSGVDAAGSVWLEAAVDGAVLWDEEVRVSRLLSRLRLAMADGRLRRGSAYGRPYWIKREEMTTDV